VGIVSIAPDATGKISVATCTPVEQAVTRKGTHAE
jgi:hypothetical protein